MYGGMYGRCVYVRGDPSIPFEHLKSSLWVFSLTIHIAKDTPKFSLEYVIKNQTKLLDERIMQLVQKCCAAMPFLLMTTVCVATLTVIMRGNGIAAQHF